MMKQASLLLILLIAILAIFVYFVIKTLKYASEKEKKSIHKGLIAYLFTESLLLSWLVYLKDSRNNRL